MTNSSVSNRFRLVPGNGGFRIAPEPGSDISLLLRLVDNDPAELHRIRPGLLVQVVGSLMVAAKSRGLDLQPKEQFSNPLLVLAEVEKLAPKAGETQPFADLPGSYASKWSLSDFYEDHAAALRAAITSKEPLDTGTFGCKKEIHYARIQRTQRNSPLLVWVKCEADDGIALADTAFWKAAGGNAHCDSGEDALRKAGVPARRVSEELANLADLANIDEENAATREVELPPDTTFEDICAALDTLSEAAEEELEARSQHIAALAAARLQELRASKEK